MKMNSAKTTRRRWIEIERVLVYYDGPQVFIASGARERRYVFVATSDGRYFGSPVSKERLREYLAERSDLHYLLRSTTDGYHYLIEAADVSKDGKKVGALPILTHEVPDDWWPERGFFASAHTEPDEIEVSSDEKNARLLVEIDGRWDAADLGAYPDRLLDAYSFVHALRDERVDTLAPRERAFQKYPWRGGISTVGFFGSLYRNVPPTERLRIEEIVYRSPGHIAVSALETVVEAIHINVRRITNDYETVRGAYRELHQGMSVRKLLGRARHEVSPTEAEIEWIKSCCEVLANALQFPYLKHVHALTAQDWVTAAKILMSYYRRVQDLADFYESGKATYKGAEAA